MKNIRFLPTTWWKIGLLICLSSGFVNAASRDGGVVTGKVVDDQKHAVAFASVALYDAKDSVLISGAASNEEGVFSIQVKPGRYYLLVRFLSYQDHIVPDVNVGSGTVDLGTIVIHQGAMQLETFTVEADRPQMELKLDKRVFNVAQDMSNRGGTAADVLDNIPSVEVDVEGAVSLRGSENVRILIDGKPSGLTGLTSTDALRMIQGDLIERVEVITNPSARYDAEGEVGIINIILKKEKNQGINGSFELRAGYPANYGASASINVKRKKINYFGSYGLGYRNRTGGGTQTQEFFYPDTSYSYDKEQDRERRDFSHNLRLGGDITVTPMSTLTVAGGFNPSTGKNITGNVYSDRDINNNLTRVIDRQDDEDSDNSQKEINLNYRKTYDQKDRLFTVDMQYEKSRRLENANISETSTEAGVEDTHQQTHQDNRRTSALFQSDYVRPFGKDGKWETGVKATYTDQDFDYFVKNRNSDNTWTLEPEYTNNVTYTDQVLAGYLMAGNKFKKVSVQGGLRFEYAELETKYEQGNFFNHREFPSLFPSAHMSYEFNEDHSLQFSYSRRVSRPRHWWMIPFFGLSDARNVFSGNPNINPEFTHSFELGYLMSGDKGNLLSSAYYRRTDGKMERIVISDSVGYTRIFPINLSVEDAYGFEFNGSYTILKGWSVNGNFNFYRAISDGTYEGIRYYSDAYAWSSRVTSKWKWKRKFNAQSSFNYRSPSKTAQGERLAMYNWDLSAAMDVFKGNGTISLGVMDILNTRRHRFISSGENFKSNVDFQWQSRTITLTLNYRLNQKRQEGKDKQNYGGQYDNGGDM
ncbi:MAG: TonB-dependent receptor [Flavobacteriales bacterium]|nr:TonB-dependent receptor [Flavobacteriales bacterium]MCB9449580.1 TonB-dependent receptor [Flavobacteriales bacterium]